MSAPWAGVGVAVPSVDAYGIGHPILEVAREAEDAGLDHVWVPDHLAFHRPVLEALTALSMIAGATRRVRVGTAILNPALRPLPWLAKELSTIGTVAPDRLLLGVGMGGEFPPEWEAAGVNVKERRRRMDDALDLLPRMLSGEVVTDYEGPHHVAGPALSPIPPSPPPVLVGGRSDAAIRRTARVGDAWLPMWMDPEPVREGLEQAAAAAAELGRAAPGAALVAFVNVCDDEAKGHEETATLVKKQYGMDYDRVRKWALVGDEDHVAGRMQAYRDAGVQGFSLAVASPDQVGQVSRVAAVRERLTAAA